MVNEIKQKPLTEKEIMFVDLYFENGFNATQAVLSISPHLQNNSARTEGWKLLTKRDVRDEIDKRMSDWRAKRRMTIEQIGDLLQDFATVDVLDIFTEDGDLKPLSEIPPSARRCIASIEVEEVWGAFFGDKNEQVGTLKKIKLVDKKGTAELLGKYKKMFTDKVEVGGADGGPLRISVSINGIKKGQG
jgi:phage terminase small subunit